MISAIVAVDKNNGIGNDGDMLFIIPEHMDNFINLTSGKKVIIGRETFENLPQAIPNRVNMVISSDKKKLTANSTKLLKCLRGIKNLNTEEEINKAFSTLTDENNAIEIWYDMQTIKTYLENVVTKDEDIYIMGGASVFKELLPYCDEIHMTRYDVEYKADTFFPNIDEDSSWEIKEESEVKIYDGSNYKSFVYKRVNK